MENELEFWLKRLEQTPNDDKVLTALAFYYLENPDGDKDIEYFKKAYFANPTLENTHNYAFWASHEYGRNELAIPLQQHVLTMSPHSHYPYLTYAQSLIDENWDKPYSITTLTKLIEMYQMAIEKVNTIYSKSHSPFLIAKILHNLAICYMLLADKRQVEQYFSQALTMGYSAIHIADDVREEAIYKIVLDFTKFHIISEQSKKALYWLEQASLSSQKDNLDIADLYGQLGDFQQAYDWMKDDFNSYSDEGYVWAFSALHKFNLSKWQNYYQNRLENAKDRLQYEQQELENAQQSGNQQEILDNQQYIAATLEEIKAVEEILTNNVPVKPTQLPIYKEFHFNHFGCLLFGCEMHNNLPSDNIY